MNFREYIQAQPDMRGPLGDFVRDAKDDREFPDVASRAELLRYLDRLHACEGAIEAGAIWWGRYIASNSGAEISWPFPEGFAIEMHGQRFCPLAIEGDKIRWRTDCPECGATFDLFTNRIFKYPTRRCNDCKRPGRPISSAPAYE